MATGEASPAAAPDTASGAVTAKAGFWDSMVELWPSLPFMALGVWNAWSALTYSGSLWLSDSEVDGTYLSQLYVFSEFACAALFLLGAAFASRGSSRARHFASNRGTVAGGLIACVGAAGVIVVGPYYLGPLFASSSAKAAVFWLFAALTGSGTGLIGLRCGALYGQLPPRRALIYTALSQLVSAFIYLLVFACPHWEPVAHGPTAPGIVAFCLLPVAAAVLACVQPPKTILVEAEGRSGGAGTEVGAASGAAPGPHAGVARLPSSFWRFVAFTFFISLITSATRSTVVTTHALAATFDGNSLLMLLRVVMALAFVVYAVRARASQMSFGKMCSLLTTFTAVATALAAAAGGLTNEWSLVVYFAASVFEFVTWCLLAFIVVQKRADALVVFGFGRGLFVLGCAIGWLLGASLMPLVPGGTATELLFVGMAGVMLLLALGLFSERDYERLFSPVSEEELALEDLFDIERRERELTGSRGGERRGRFSRAVAEVAVAHALTEREAEVLRCLAMGYGSDRIADTMQVKVNTVRAHTHNVYVKLDVHSREEVMRLVDAAVARQK